MLGGVGAAKPLIEGLAQDCDCVLLLDPACGSELRIRLADQTCCVTSPPLLPPPGLKTARHSSSNFRVTFGGMPHAGNPSSPYPSSLGIKSSQISPTRIPSAPWSHPVITSPTPAVYSNASSPGSLVDQNLDPATLPSAWTTTVLPSVTTAPLPARSTRLEVRNPGRISASLPSAWLLGGGGGEGALEMTTLLTLIGSFGLSPSLVGAFDIATTTSIPLDTLPNTGCALSDSSLNQSRKSFSTTLTKNWLPPEFGPALAMERVPGSFDILAVSSSGMHPFSPPLR
mmetsp:Transcript_68135/g.152088  ORF Transcript_68135/g.152088 Transcript_68135/m.152088 type:complete len:285 (+) Transcript_68135:273-1127(+)